MIPKVAFGQGDGRWKMGDRGWKMKGIYINLSGCIGFRERVGRFTWKG
jgi:hypothetical protein